MIRWTKYVMAKWCIWIVLFSSLAWMIDRLPDLLAEWRMQLPNRMMNSGRSNCLYWLLNCFRFSVNTGTISNVCATVFWLLWHICEASPYLYNNYKILLLFNNRIAEEDRKKRLQQQASENLFHKFVEGNLILKQGLLDKRVVWIIYLLNIQVCVKICR